MSYSTAVDRFGVCWYLYRLYVCVYGQKFQQSMNQPGFVAYAWSAEQGNMNISLSPFAPENLVSGDEFGRPVPHQPAHYPLHSG